MKLPMWQVKDKKIVEWTVTTKEPLTKLNLGNEGDPKEVLLMQSYQCLFKHKAKDYWLIIVMSLLGVTKIWKECLGKFVNTKLS